MNKKNNKTIFTLTLIAVVAFGLITIMGGPINPDGGVFLPFLGR